MTDPLDDLRRQFHEAAVREMTPRRRSWRSRLLDRRVAIAAVAILGTTGAATAVELISVGEDRSVNPEIERVYGVGEGQGRLALTAKDADRPVPWAVVTYRRNGEPCAAVGQLRGAQLGQRVKGVFRPYGKRSPGSCRDLTTSDYFVDLNFIDGRSLLSGRAAPSVKQVILTYEGEVRRATPTKEGAFLFVFDAGLEIGKVKITTE